MNETTPILHISIYYQGNSASKTQLQKNISEYTNKQDRWSPLIDICVDTLDSYEEKQVQHKMLYDAVVTNSIVKSLEDTNQLCTFINILISITLQRLYEDNTNSNYEDWMLMSIIPSKENDNSYSIKWSLGL